MAKAAAGATAPGCLDEAQLSALLERALSDEAAAQIEEHMDGCAGCRALVAELVRLGSSSGPAELPDGGQGLLIAERYRLIEPIGAGGMGVVYLAEDLRLSRKVAIKMMRSTDGAAGEPHAGQLLREAKILASLSHPSIVIVHDVGTCGEQVFMAMEYVRGTSLRHWLEQERPGLAALLAIFQQVGRALHVAHQAGLLHQDFKPENVLVSPDGRARLSDFGLACAIGSGPREGRGPLAGTPAYIAPEVYRGAVPGPQSDQFAFCVSLYEALYGEHPFGQGLPRGEAARAILRGALRPPSAARGPGERPAVPAWLRGVVLRGLSADPDRRFSSMADLCRYLEHDVTQHQEPGAPLPPSRRSGHGVARGMRRAIGRIRRRLGL